MPAFRLLSDPARYVACDWDLTADRAGLRYWVSHFMEHYHSLDRLIRVEYAPTEARLEEFRRAYLAAVEELLAEPERFGRLTILALDRVRDEYLRRFGFPDPFRHVKQKENEAALAVYPRLIAELDSRPADARLAELVVGVFAGNIFDLGAMATVKRYHESGLDFFATRQTLPNRPWLEDDLDLIVERWSPSGWRYRKVMFLVDNAGCDFVLGCLPLIREFARRPRPVATRGRGDAGTRGTRAGGRARGRGGDETARTNGEKFEIRNPKSEMDSAEVIVAVNTGPSLNDILADEAEAVFAAARQADPVLDEKLSSGRIRVVQSGNNAPLIDLLEVSDDLNAAAAGVDLLILEGMGRSVESNHYARFTVDTAKFALLKDPRVAARVGGKLFDICCKFEPVSNVQRQMKNGD